MKKNKKYIYIFITLFLIFPCFTFAATELTASTQNPIVGENLYIQLEANYGDKVNIKDFHVYLNYDTTYLELEKVVWVKSKGQMGTYVAENGRVYVDKTNGNWTSGPIMHVYFRVKKSGSTQVDIVETAPAYYSDGSKISQTMAGIIINSVNPSTNTELASLYVKNYNMQPAFKKSQLTYNLTVPSEVDEIEIVAKRSDAYQTIKGNGIKTLKYGENKFSIVVTAQNKSSRTYEITIIRTDNRTGDTSLRQLSVTNTPLQYIENQKVYEASVSRSVDSVLISARTNDPLATLTGTGTKQLEIGTNTFELLVTSAAGRKETYTIKIIRSTEELQEPVVNSKLKSLKVNSLVLNLAGDNTLFLYGIDKNISELSIDAVPQSETAVVKITGNEKLQEGINPITITVSQIMEAATEETEAVIETTEYKLLVYKNINNATEIDSLDKITEKNNYVYTTSTQENTVLSRSKVEMLVNNKKHLYYNVVNMYNGLLYQAKIPNNIIPTEIDLKINKLESIDLSFSTKLPEQTELTVYLENKYPDGSSVQIYSYEEGGAYTLVTAGLEVKNGYITFLTNDQSNYIITQSNLIQAQSDADKLISTIKTILITIIGIVLAIIIIPRLFKKKTKTKEKEEPLY